MPQDDSVARVQSAPETAAFWQGLERGELMVKKCRHCEQVHFYPRSSCPFCFSEDTEWLKSSGRGTIYSFSILRRVRQPYCIAYVTLEEDVSLMTNIVDTAFEDIRIGARVQLVVKQVGDTLLPLFTQIDQRTPVERIKG